MFLIAKYDRGYGRCDCRLKYSAMMCPRGNRFKRQNPLALAGAKLYMHLFTLRNENVWGIRAHASRGLNQPHVEKEMQLEIIRRVSIHSHRPTSLD